MVHIQPEKVLIRLHPPRKSF